MFYMPHSGGDKSPQTVSPISYIINFEWVGFKGRPMQDTFMRFDVTS